MSHSREKQSSSDSQRLCQNKDKPRTRESSGENQLLTSSQRKRESSNGNSSPRLGRKRPRRISTISDSVSPPTPAVTRAVFTSRTVREPKSKRPDRMRLKVEEAMSLYRKELENLRAEHERDPKARRKNTLPMVAANIVQLSWANKEKRIGKVAGVEIGDKFEYRAELCVVGLHGQMFKGIDYIKKYDMLLALSIVDSRRYPNKPSENELIYIGSGENPSITNQKIVNDQKLTGGNLPLSNSMHEGTPVRVIVKKTDGFVYDGLYEVKKRWKGKM